MATHRRTEAKRGVPKPHKDSISGGGLWNGNENGNGKRECEERETGEHAALQCDDTSAAALAVDSLACIRFNHNADRPLHALSRNRIVY